MCTARQSVKLDRLMIAQATGSAIVGPARADIFWGAGDQAGQLAGRVHHPDKFALLVPRELDPVAAGARMPLPPEKPPPPAEAKVRTPVLKPALKSAATPSRPSQFGRSVHAKLPGRVAARSR
jgi:membrane-bound lytic murein transglycosylase A